MSPNPKFTPEALITAPRPSAAVPNDEGKLALYTVSTYDLDTHTNFTDVKLLDLETGTSTRYSNNPKETSFRWLHKSSLLWEREAESKATELWIGDANQTTRPYLAGTIDAKLDNVKTHRLDNGDIALVFTAAANAEQNLHNTAKADKPQSTAREWTHSRPKRWDTYVDQYRSVIWYTVLKFDETSQKWHLSTNGPINALRGTGLVVPLYANSASSADFDISNYGILFSTATPGDTEWLQTQKSLYFVPLSTFDETEAPTLKRIQVPDHADIVTNPTFAPTGPLAAFLVDQTSEEWSHKSIGLLNVETLTIPSFLRTTNSTGTQAWDVFPDEILWANDNSSLYLTASHQARSRLFHVPIPPTTSSSSSSSQTHPVTPTPLDIPGSISAIYSLSTDPSNPHLLATSSSFIDQATFIILHPTTQTAQILHTTSSHGAYFGISANQITSITFPGGPDAQTPIQTWIITPSWYNPNTADKHPLFLFMHGGPHSASRDAWTWRWNALLLAEQGYIVAIPNFTGSDSFGGAFARAVSLQWGGHPYTDIERCFTWIEQNLSTKCDTTRAVAAGASYGGYMALYVAGQPLAKRLKAIICHDGVFDVVSELLSDDLAQKQDLTRSFGSPFFTDAAPDAAHVKDLWRKWNPAEYLTNWSTPLLVIHSDRDFRCPSTAGWAAYAVCRMKGIETRMLNFPDENHFVLGRENSLVWWRNVIGWCNRFVGVEGGVVLEEARSEPRWLGEVIEGRVVDV